MSLDPKSAAVGAGVAAAGILLLGGSLTGSKTSKKGLSGLGATKRKKSSTTKKASTAKKSSAPKRKAATGTKRKSTTRKK